MSFGPPCLVCNHPDRPTIDQKLASGHSVLSVSREHNLEASRSSVYRHFRSGHVPRSLTGGESLPAVNGGPQSETIEKATRLAKAAERHMRKAMRSDDLKAANGALQSAAKAFELFGKARSELQYGPTVNVQVSANAQAAIGVLAEAQALSVGDTLDAAATFIRAQLEAGDADAVRMVLELMRMIPSADATLQGVTGALAPSASAIIPEPSREP